MNIRDALDQVDALKPNQFDEQQKIYWLSQVDQRIYNDVVLRHEMDESMPETFDGYPPDVDQDTQLLASAPFDALYRWWLEAMIDLGNGELGKYQNSMLLFNSAWNDFAKDYRRKHMPLGQQKIGFTAGGRKPCGATGDAMDRITQATQDANKAAFSAQLIAQTLQEKLASGELKGEKGDTGPAGATGPAGPQGPKGDPGEPGGGSVTAESIAAALGYTPAKVDDAVFSARDAWSSQRIVDMFCPPMEEEGNPVQCWPIPGYPLGVVASWTPTQAGSGDPSADNVRPITGRSSVSIEHCGETLWNWNAVTATGYNNSVQQYLDMYKINALPRNTSLYLSGSITGASGAGKFEMGFYTAGYAKTLGTLRSNGTPSTVIQDGEIAIVHLTGGESSSASRTFHDLQISLGSSAPSAYAPYSGTTKTLALPATIYGGEVDAVTGEGKKTWEIIDSYAGETLPGEWISDRDVYAVGGTPTMGAQVAYKLAEPVAFNVTGGEAVSAKAGVNTFLTNANSVKVTGKDDPIHKIQQLSYAVVSLGGNV